MVLGALVKFAIKRLIDGIITLFLLVLFVFILIHAAAPNPAALARIYAGNPHAPPSEIQQIINEYVLNKPTLLIRHYKRKWWRRHIV